MNIVVYNNQLWIIKKEGNNDITLFYEEICSTFFEIASKRNDFINFLLEINYKSVELVINCLMKYRKAILEKSFLDRNNEIIPLYKDVFVKFFNSFKKKEESKGYSLIITYFINYIENSHLKFSIRTRNELINHGEKNIEKFCDIVRSEINNIISNIQDEIRKLVDKINKLEIIDKLYSSKSYNDFFEYIAKYNFHINYFKQKFDFFYDASDFTIPSKKYNYYAIRGSEIINSYKTEKELNNSLKIVNEYTDVDLCDYFNICIDYLYTNKINFNKCKNCRKYFIPKSKSNEELCHYIFKEGKTCSELSAKLKQEADKILYLYTSKYKVGNNKFNRLLKDNIYPPDLLNNKWEEWKKIMLERRDKAYIEREKGKDINEIIKSYEAWLKKHRFMGDKNEY